MRVPMCTPKPVSGGEDRATAVTRTSSLEAPRHGRTREFPERILPHPPCRRVLRIRQAPRHHHGRGIERAIAFADRAQGHVRGLLDEVAFVTGFAFDEGEALFERFVAGSTCRAR